MDNFIAMVLFSPFLYSPLHPTFQAGAYEDFSLKQGLQTQESSSEIDSSVYDNQDEFEDQSQKKEMIKNYLTRNTFEQEIFEMVVNDDSFWEQKKSLHSTQIIKEMNIVSNHIKHLILHSSFRKRHIFETDLIFSENFKISTSSFSALLKIPFEKIIKNKNTSWVPKIKSVSQKIQRKRDKTLKSWVKRHWGTDFEKETALSYINSNNINISLIENNTIIHHIQNMICSKAALFIEAEKIIENIKNGRTRWVLELVEIHEKIENNITSEKKSYNTAINYDLKKIPTKYKTIQKDMHSILHSFEDQYDFFLHSHTPLRGHVSNTNHIAPKKMIGFFNLKYKNSKKVKEILKELKKTNIHMTPSIKVKVTSLVNNQESSASIISRIYCDILNQKKHEDIEKEKERLQKEIKSHQREKINYSNLVDENLSKVKQDILSNIFDDL